MEISALAKVSLTASLQTLHKSPIRRQEFHRKLRLTCLLHIQEHHCNSLTSRDVKLAEFAKCVDLDEAAHNEPPHLDLHCLPSSLCIFNMILLGLDIL